MVLRGRHESGESVAISKRRALIPAGELLQLRAGVPRCRPANADAGPGHSLFDPCRAPFHRGVAFVVIRHAGLKSATGANLIGTAARGGAGRFMEMRPAAGGADVSHGSGRNEAPRLAIEIAGAAGLEEGLGRAVGIVGGERSGLWIEDAPDPGCIDLCRKTFGLRALAELPGHARVVFGIARAEVRAVPREMIGQRSGMAPRLAGRGRLTRSARGSSVEEIRDAEPRRWRGSGRGRA